MLCLMLSLTSFLLASHVGAFKLPLGLPFDFFATLSLPSHAGSLVLFLGHWECID